MEKYQARPNGEAPQKTQDQINAENNANTLKNAADVAIATKNPYAMAAGYAVKGLDKITGGKSTQYLGEKMNEMNKVAPGGKQIQNLSNKLSESGAGDAIGKAASMKSGGGTQGANAAASTASTASAANSASTASNTASTASNSLNKDGNVGSETSKRKPNASSSESSSSSNNESTKSDSMLGSAFGDGGFDISKLIKSKYLFIGFGGFFVFIILMTVVVSAKDHGNLDITNKSESMGGYVAESMTVVTPGSASSIEDSSLNGKNGQKISSGQTLTSLLGENGITLLNQTIATSAQNAGYGTGAAPAAAAQALIQSLLNNNIVIPYFWGGGHGLISTGANGSWGTSTYVSVSGHSTSYSYQPLGLDCSGFVSWALYNGGCKDFTPRVAADFKLLGASTTFSAAKPGDILASNSHVVLVLENRGDSLLCAESSTNGVVFSNHKESAFKGYKIVDMANYYQLYCS